MAGTPMVEAKLEITLKFTDLPTGKVVENGHIQFILRAGGRDVSVTVKPKIFRKLEQAQAEWPQWVAALGGRIGPPTPGGKGFVLLEPALQVFERKAKAPADAPPA